MAPSRNGTSPLRCSDVVLWKNPGSDMVELCIRYSKTDQCGQGCTIAIPAGQAPNSSVCPFSVTQTYLTMHPQSPHFDGSPVRRFQFTAVLKRALQFMGLQDAHYTSHSFQIGAATSAAKAGIPQANIQRMGHWQSGV